jgi:hypothetical protein
MSLPTLAANCVQRLHSDNGTCYRSHLFVAAAEQRGLKLWHTGPTAADPDPRGEAVSERVEAGVHRRTWSLVLERYDVVRASQREADHLIALAAGDHTQRL